MPSEDEWYFTRTNLPKYLIFNEVEDNTSGTVRYITKLYTRDKCSISNGRISFKEIYSLSTEEYEKLVDDVFVRKVDTEDYTDQVEMTILLNCIESFVSQWN